MDTFEKREKRDLELYKLFCENMGVSTDDIKTPKSKYSHYDIGHKGCFVELKNRERYPYDQYNDVYIECCKIEWLKDLYENYKDKGCKGSKLIFFYPHNDKVVVIDVHKIIWKNVIDGTYDCNNVYLWKTTQRMNRQTSVSKKDKVMKDVYAVPLPHHHQINCVKVYDLPRLGEEFKRLNDELGITV